MKSLALKRLPLLFFIVMTLSSLGKIVAQEESSQFWDNVRFGGGLGVSFGDGFFSGTLAPSAIYQIDPQFAAGVGLSGTYSTQKNVFKATILGGSVLALYNIIPELQLSAEFEENYVTRNFDEAIALEDDEYFYPALFLGVGYQAGPVTIGVRYDVIYDEDRSIYGSGLVPFVRVYF